MQQRTTYRADQEGLFGSYSLACCSVHVRGISSLCLHLLLQVNDGHEPTAFQHAYVRVSVKYFLSSSLYTHKMPLSMQTVCKQCHKRHLRQVSGCCCACNGWFAHLYVHESCWLRYHHGGHGTMSQLKVQQHWQMKVVQQEAKHGAVLPACSPLKTAKSLLLKKITLTYTFAEALIVVDYQHYDTKPLPSASWQDSIYLGLKGVAVNVSSHRL